MEIKEKRQEKREWKGKARKERERKERKGRGKKEEGKGSWSGKRGWQMVRGCGSWYNLSFRGQNATADTAISPGYSIYGERITQHIGWVWTIEER